MNTNFDIQHVKGGKPSLNGELTAMLALSVDGENRLVRKVNLGSDVTVTRLANEWSNEYELDKHAVVRRLNEIGTAVTALLQESQERIKSAPKATRRVSELARSFLQSLRPLWHRKGKSLYLDAIEREVPLTEMWTLAGNGTVDDVGATVEARELSPDPSNPPDYRRRLMLLRDALRMAAGTLIKTLPELEEVEHDHTVSGDQLIHVLARLLLVSRTYRGDVESSQFSYLEWARGVAPGSGWQQCFSDPVFAKVEESNEAGLSEPVIAMSGDHLTAELRHKSKRRLAADLRSIEAADTDSTLRCNARVWRVWTLKPVIIDSIGGPADE